jgi:hypothetical protein
LRRQITALQQLHGHLKHSCKKRATFFLADLPPEQSTAVLALRRMAETGTDSGAASFYFAWAADLRRTGGGRAAEACRKDAAARVPVPRSLD